MKKTAAKKVEVGEFNAGDLLASMTEFVEDIKSGNTHTLRSKTLDLPGPLPPRTGVEVKAIRQKLQASQAVFARLLNVSLASVIGWENNQRQPSGPVLKLLDIADKDPGVFIGHSAPSGEHPLTIIKRLRSNEKAKEKVELEEAARKTASERRREAESARDGQRAALLSRRSQPDPSSR